MAIEGSFSQNLSYSIENPADRTMFLGIFLIVLLMFCIIFINFIIAKAMESHADFTQR